MTHTPGRMRDLDLYAHLAAYGDVLGVGIGGRPAEWEARLGSDHLDVSSHGVLRRDHGLVELAFREDHGTWRCSGISLQVHRLGHGDPSTVPVPLRDTYGPFARRARFDELTAVITGLGHPIEPDNDATTTDVHRYRVPRSGARIFVVADPDPYGDGEEDPDESACPEAGDVWAVDFSPAWWPVTD
ncbi:hypothetical protein Q5762_12125 [Streptomyces sp. P9(2023)]|uniref:hypothetical protein n=1 Tax=Streptomyces sp. P9(2023) TaxID=3064394 RepID=UPI0028F3E349|nr:hypothetical protein [Streptomyces sp. P9(2023)]MDT9689075.1 hypothetical protein [Streptomyces sp. P9(2023)]